MTADAGYSHTPLPRKLGIGPEDAVALVGAPEWFIDMLGGLPEVAAVHTDLSGAELFDVIIVFVERRAEFEAELGRLADPPMTKDAVAGRIRRLLSMADRKAKVEGIPDTESAVTPDLLEDA